MDFSMHTTQHCTQLMTTLATGFEAAELRLTRSRMHTIVLQIAISNAPKAAVPMP